MPKSGFAGFWPEIRPNFQTTPKPDGKEFQVAYFCRRLGILFSRVLGLFEILADLRPPKIPKFSGLTRKFTIQGKNLSQSSNFAKIAKNRDFGDFCHFWQKSPTMTFKSQAFEKSQKCDFRESHVGREKWPQVASGGPFCRLRPFLVGAGGLDRPSCVLRTQLCVNTNVLAHSCQLAQQAELVGQRWLGSVSRPRSPGL